jgi:ubiquinone/menaquinone biosynthesis C-methylase UbiE
MKSNLLKQHWETIYKTKDTTKEVSWYQDDPHTSVDLILSTDINKDSNIIDIGGGDSKLVDALLKLGFKDISVLDISPTALTKAKKRLGQTANQINWIETDVLTFKTDLRFDVWHDRAAFHFLTKRTDIDGYVKTAGKLINPGGYLIISAFSTNGPTQCSGLDITQYSEDLLKRTFAKKFKHIKSFEQIHKTPFDTKQIFLCTLFKKLK